jgi:branched-subunit amino acid transport protein AzlD
MEDICRFCFIGHEFESDPLLSPCKCAGSIKYVHKLCLKKWRIYAPQNIQRVQCQLCHSEFELPRKWPNESVPNFTTKIWKYILNPFIPIIILFNIQYIYVVRFIDTVYSDNPTIDMQMKIASDDTKLFVLYVIWCLTTVYISIYTYLCFNVLNKYEYFIRYLPRVLPFILFNCLILYFYKVCIFQLGFVYAYLLPKFIEKHSEVLIILNLENCDM